MACQVQNIHIASSAPVGKGYAKNFDNCDSIDILGVVEGAVFLVSSSVYYQQKQSQHTCSGWP